MNKKDTALIFPLSPCEAEAEGYVWAWGQSGLHSEFQTIQSYTVKNCHEGGKAEDKDVNDKIDFCDRTL